MQQWGLVMGQGAAEQAAPAPDLVGQHQAAPAPAPALAGPAGHAPVHPVAWGPGAADPGAAPAVVAGQQPPPEPADAAELRQLREDAEVMVRRHSHAITDMQRRHGDAITELQGHYGQLRTEMLQVQVEQLNLEELRNDHDEMKRDLGRLMDDNNEMKRDLEQMRNEHNEMKRQYDKLMLEHADVKYNLQQYVDTSPHWIQRIAHLEGQLSLWQQTEADMRHAIESLPRSMGGSRQGQYPDAMQ